MRVRTSVMGMLGAFGKMNETSSNLLRLRQFSARKILRVLAACLGDTNNVSHHPAPESPKP